MKAHFQARGLIYCSNDRATFIGCAADTLPIFYSYTYFMPDTLPILYNYTYFMPDTLLIFYNYTYFMPMFFAFKLPIFYGYTLSMIHPTFLCIYITNILTTHCAYFMPLQCCQLCIAYTFPVSHLTLAISCAHTISVSCVWIRCTTHIHNFCKS